LGSKKRHGSWCPICGEEKRIFNKSSSDKYTIYTIDDLREYAKNKNGECLGKEYKNPRETIEWYCNAHKKAFIIVGVISYI